MIARRMFHLRRNQDYPLKALLAKKGFIPNNTHRCNKWALNNFKSWLAASLSIGDDDTDRYHEDILLMDDPKLLCRYVMETRKENSEKYPPKVIV